MYRENRRTGIIANLNLATATGIAVAKDTKVGTLERAERDCLNDRGRKNGYQE